MTDIFISYASEDRARVAPLVAALEAHGWTVFWDVAIATGADWRGWIVERLRDSRCVVVVWSSQSVGKRWVLEEAEEAVKQNKRILPLRVDDVEPPLGFRTFQAASFISWDGTPENEAFRKLTVVLEDWLGVPVKKASTLAARPLESQKRRRSEYLTAGIGIGLAIVVALAWFGWYRRTEMVTGRSKQQVVAAPVLEAIDDHYENLYGRIGLDVLRNDHSTMNGPLRVLNLTAPSHGTAVLSADGTRITYQAPPDYLGEDSFAYSLGSDAAHHSAKVSVKNAPLNRTLTNSFGIDFVLVPAGSFEMGSEKGEPDERPVHSVTISRPFYLGRYEITQEQWKQVIGKPINDQVNVSKASLGRYGSGPNYPMYWVNWHDAQAFAKALNEAEGCVDCYRLPTEAEWEHAAKLGNRAGVGITQDSAWLSVAQQTPEQAREVGSKRPNDLGIFDLHGNVWEWVADHSEKIAKYEPASTTDPLNASGAPFRIIRGGSWQTTIHKARSENRGVNNASGAARDLGFRLVRRAY